MIQRIQSVFFLLAALTSALLFVLPIYTIDLGGVSTAYRITNHAHYSLILSMLAGLTIGLPLATIFQYKKRPLQVTLGRINQLALVALLAVAVFSFDSARNEAAQAITGVSVGMFLPIAAIAFTILAIRGVKKDEALVRSSERIR